MTDLFEVVTTAIVSRPGPMGRQALILQRDHGKKRFPGMWTVPGGHLELVDFTNRPKDSEDYWYGVLEETLRREVREEAGIEVGPISYVTSLATVHHDGNVIVISCRADWVSGEVVLQPGETIDHRWVMLSQAREYDLIDGIYEELVMAARERRGWACA